MVDKFGLRTWIFRLTCLVFKTTCIDAEKPLREGAFSFTRRTLSPPLDKRNTRDTEKGLCISSERYLGELGVRYLSSTNSGRDSLQQAHSHFITSSIPMIRWSFAPPYYGMIGGTPTIGIDHSQGILHQCEKTFGKKCECRH